MCCQAKAQFKIDIDVHARVNINDSTVNKVVQLYKNYLQNRPDSVQSQNPFWCSADKKKFSDFDFTRSFLYDAIPMKNFVVLYRFVILSIEKENEGYAIRTAFIAKDISQPYMAKQNPWAITRIYAIKENGEWKLKNAFEFKVKDWKSVTDGNIIYHHPNKIVLDKQELKKSKTFCDSIAKLLQIKSWSAFDYYIAQTPDEMCELLGFDFAMTAYTTGMAFQKDILLNGTGSAYYPHEFVHHVAEEKNIKNKFINEGLATWLGGSRLKSFKENVESLSDFVSKNDTITLDNVLEEGAGWTVGGYYTSGAIFCKLVYEKKGLKGLEELFLLPANDNTVLKKKLMQLLEVTNLEILWRNALQNK